MEWFALYVKSRHEFFTNGELQKKGIQTFLPAVKKMSQWSDRKKLIDFPLFPGYLFFRVLRDNNIFFTVLNTKGAVKIISGEEGHPIPVPVAEIDSLKLLIESGQEIDIYPNLKEGLRVRIAKGPLTGAEGILGKKEEQYMFLVNVELLGRSIGVTIHADCLESI
ncbi:MAG: UpxY family transcription antiterminator [Nitrospirota bacterium]